MQVTHPESVAAGPILREARQKIQPPLTQEQFANRLGCDPSSVSALETNPARQLQPSTVADYVRALWPDLDLIRMAVLLKDLADASYPYRRLFPNPQAPISLAEVTERLHQSLTLPSNWDAIREHETRIAETFWGEVGEKANHPFTVTPCNRSTADMARVELCNQQAQMAERALRRWLKTSYETPIPQPKLSELLSGLLKVPKRAHFYTPPELIAPIKDTYNLLVRVFPDIAGSQIDSLYQALLTPGSDYAKSIQADSLSGWHDTEASIRPPNLSLSYYEISAIQGREPRVLDLVNYLVATHYLAWREKHDTGQEIGHFDPYPYHTVLGLFDSRPALRVNRQTKGKFRLLFGIDPSIHSSFGGLRTLG